MGLDISIEFDKRDELDSTSDGHEIRSKLNLSRTFCNFLCRRNVVENHTPELEQIGNITGVNIQFFYNMEAYTEEWEINEMLEFETDNNVKENKRQLMIADNQKVENNIDLVVNQLELLIDKLSQIDNLPDLLKKTDYDTIGIKKYFSSFNESPGDGYIGNNFGQDLRNLITVIRYSREKGAKTTYFNYG